MKQKCYLSVGLLLLICILHTLSAVTSFGPSNGVLKEKIRFICFCSLFFLSFFFIYFPSLSLSLLFSITFSLWAVKKSNEMSRVFCICALTMSAFLSICFTFRFPRVQMYFALPTSHICALVDPLTVAVSVCLLVGWLLLLLLLALQFNKFVQLTLNYSHSTLKSLAFKSIWNNNLYPSVWTVQFHNLVVESIQFAIH